MNGTWAWKVSVLLLVAGGGAVVGAVATVVVAMYTILPMGFAMGATVTMPRPGGLRVVVHADLREVGMWFSPPVLPQVGSIAAFTSSEVSPGWLECRGQSVAQSEYPALVEALMQRDAVDGLRDGEIRLPDLRGLMCRDQVEDDLLTMLGGVVTLEHAVFLGDHSGLDRQPRAVRWAVRVE